MNIIHTDAAPTPRGHYSQAVEHNGLVFVSGMLPELGVIDPGTHDFMQQAEAVLRQCEAVLAAAGCRYADVVQATVYLVGVENWAVFNDVYSRFLGTHKPARVVVPVPALHHGYAVELQLIAALPNGRNAM
ncbi:Translation initiation inhibitor [Collimonas arenae]|uniref:Translation initiation inhibitor n=1 Tax=Collimonas arenae TaxID=279058 RepID=A0A0A1F3S3_9BURK|nr:RidA family protein [Collimonas arenae]AIY39196.1 Translation initiation inhibitor [Collimonas arenae]